VQQEEEEEERRGGEQEGGEPGELGGFVEPGLAGCLTSATGRRVISMAITAGREKK